MPAQPIKLDPAEARRRINVMIRDHKNRLEQIDREQDTGAYLHWYWNKVALEMALEAMKEKA
jgi:hypothetical protein